MRTESRGCCRTHADLTVCGALDGIQSERWPEEIATQPLEPAAVATVHSDGGMQLHAEGGDEQGDPARVRGARTAVPGASPLIQGGVGRPPALEHLAGPLAEGLFDRRASLQTEAT